MDTLIRAGAIYFGLLIVLRGSGKRSLGQVTTFDFVLLLIIAETTQQALVGDDFSITNMLLIVLVLTGVDLGLSVVKQRVPSVEKWVDGMPTVLVRNGEVLRDRMQRERVDEEDVMTAARELGIRDGFLLVEDQPRPSASGEHAGENRT